MKPNFNDLIARLGIESYPLLLEELYDTLDEPRYELSPSYIEAFEERFKLFGEHFDALMRVAKFVINDNDLAFYMSAASLYLDKVGGSNEACRVVFPPCFNTPEYAMGPALAIISALAITYDKYVARGFSHEEAIAHLDNVGKSINLFKEREGYPGVDRGYFHWITLYLYCEIFDLEGFQFQFRKIDCQVTYLKNSKTGEILPLAVGDFHKSGRIIGAAGLDSADGTFTADIQQTDTEIIGYPIVDASATNIAKSYPKSEWSIWLTPADEVMSVHIARGADVSPENFEQQCRCALDIAARRFSDHRAKAIFCASWLLSWELYDLLDKDSRIIKFGEQFSRFPHMSPNHSFFMFIFGRDSDDISSLPENTSLRRKVKEYYMRGGFMHVAGGIYKKDLK